MSLKKMVETQAKNMVMEMQQMFAAQGMNLGDMGQSPEQLIESYKQPAEKRSVHRSFWKRLRKRKIWMLMRARSRQNMRSLPDRWVRMLPL